jgi:hypothetical protein
MTWTQSVTAARLNCEAACMPRCRRGRSCARSPTAVSANSRPPPASSWCSSRGTPLPGVAVVTFIDVDSLLRRMYGKKKQGVGFGAREGRPVPGAAARLQPFVATISTPDAAR